MKTKSVPISWVISEEHRFDCGPFTRGGIEAKKTLEGLNVPKKKLSELTLGGLDGMYHVGMDKLRWVDGPEYGVPFLRSADILRADLSSQPYISRAQVKANPLFTCPAGSTLITRSGTIGRMTYCRDDMAEMAMSQDVLKVVPDTGKVASGYLYAFLSSKYGVPLIVNGTFGSIIVHIEAENIAELPVPRLGDEVERNAHDLIEGAASARVRAVQHKRHARKLLLERLGLDDISSAGTPTSFAVFSVDSSGLSRLDAAFHSPVCRTAATQLATASPRNRALADLARVFTPGIFKRRYVDAPEYGYPYFSGTELFQLDAAPRGYLAKKWSEIEEYRVATDWLLIQDAGQLGGLIGSVVRVPPHFAGSVVSNHLMRVAVEEREVAAFLFAVLTSAHGYRAIVRNAFGSSIPQLDPKHIAQLMLPWPDRSVRKEVSELVLRAWKLEDEAIADERQAVALVEHAIQEAA
jgi:type I restriction enzyme S subunit